MSIVAEQTFFFRLSHRGTGYATGPIMTIDHMVIPVRSPGFISVHVGLSRVQATSDGPLGAAAGVMRFGNREFGLGATFWRPVISGNAGSWTTAFQVSKGDMTAWESFQVFQ
jgi:hypothetical protein